jgi:hypothetical protein
VDQHNEAARATYGRLGMAATGYLVYEDEWPAQKHAATT